MLEQTLDLLALAVTFFFSFLWKTENPISHKKQCKDVKKMSIELAVRYRCKTAVNLQIGRSVFSFYFIFSRRWLFLSTVGPMGQLTWRWNKKNRANQTVPQKDWCIPSHHFDSLLTDFFLTALFDHSHLLKPLVMMQNMAPLVDAVPVKTNIPTLVDLTSFGSHRQTHFLSLSEKEEQTFSKTCNFTIIFAYSFAENWKNADEDGQKT